MSRLLIVDGHAYAYRAFHAIRELRGPAGQPTNAIYGFVKMVDKMRQAVQPTHFIVVWDGGLDERRMVSLPDYKAHRPAMPEDLRPQLDGMVEYLAAAGLASYCGEGIEADDYIACLARQAEAAGWNVVIASADKDFMQLVTPQIGLLNPNDKTGGIWGREQVRAKSGVEPEQISGWLALMGDAVDNIPGVPGVGPKTAAELMQKFGAVPELLSRVDEVKSVKIRAALKASAEIVRRNMELVKLREVPCRFEPEMLVKKPGDEAKLRELFQRWGFRGMLERPGPQPVLEQRELI